MPKQLSGYLDNGRGEPLADIPAVATILGTDTVVDATLTDSDGHWVFDDLPTADEYLVTLSDTAGNAVSRAPWSGELREAYVRDRLDVGGLPVLVDPAVDNSLAWTATGLYVPPAPVTDLTNYYTKTEADALFLTSAEADALFLTPAEGNAAYATTGHNHAAAYVDVGGDTMTGGLTISAGGIAVTGASTFSVAPTVGGSALLTATAADTLFLTPAEGNAAYATSAHNHDTTYVQLTGGSVMTGLLGPSTHNTRDLGTTGTRWRALYGMTGDFTTSLTVATKPLVISPDGANIVEWRANGLYAAAGAVSDIWVNTTGDTMTGDLLMTAHILPTTTNTRDLGSTSAKWRKVWATDADFTNSPTVGGSALLTATAADALFLTPAEGNAAYATAAHAHAAAYVDVGGDTMTGDLNMTANVLPTVTNTRDLGSTSLRWRKVWAVDGEFTNTPTVGGVALPTSTHNHDAAYVNVGGDTMTAGLTISSGDLVLTAGRLYINQANAGLEFGASGTSNTPFFDFHSGAVGVDYDTRLLGSGGTGVNGGGLLTLEGRFTVTAAVLLNTTLSVNSRPVIMAGCRVYHNAAQTLLTGATTVLAFNSERYDTDTLHDPVTNNNRLTVPTGLAGKYLIHATVEISAHATGRRLAIIRTGAGTQIAAHAVVANSGTLATAITLSTVYDLAVGDWVELAIYQDSGASLTANAAPSYSPEFGMQRIG